MIVGEAYGATEAAEGKPFVGKSGKLLDGMLKRARTPRETCFVTNVVNRQPPDNKLESRTHAWWTDKKTKAEAFGCTHFAAGQWFNDYIREGLDALANEISSRQPEVIVALGNLALWALTRNVGIGNWRGSELWWQGPLFDETPPKWEGPIPVQSPGAVVTLPASTIAVVPTYHPAFILRKWDVYPTVMHDLRKRVVGKLDNPAAREEPRWNFFIPKTIHDALNTLDDVRREKLLTNDIETRYGRIACVGFGWGTLDALCVPFAHVNGDRYWNATEEIALTRAVRAVVEGGAVIGNQNYNYDRQYFSADPAFGFTPRCDFDTMIAQHLLYPGTPKDLSHLSSLYCAHHRFWKEEGRELTDNMDEERWWWYNCLDCVKTWEIWTVQEPMLRKAGFL